MIHTLPDLDVLADIVRSAAREELLPRFNRVAREHKADGSVLTEADLAIDKRLRAELAPIVLTTLVLTRANIL